MDNLEYLNQIAQSNRPEQRPQTFLSGPIFKVLVGGIIALAIILVLGAIVNGGSSKSDALTKQLYLQTTSLNTTVTTYNKSLKISNLRAISLSLSATLTSATGQLSNYLTNHGTDVTALVEAEETNPDTELNDILYKAKLNGILDRIYASQINLQVSLLLQLVSQNLSRTKDAELTSILEQYWSNLTMVSTSFESYLNP